MDNKQFDFDLESLHSFLSPSLFQFFVDDSLEQTTPIQLESQPAPMLEPAQPTSSSSISSNSLSQAVNLGDDPYEVPNPKRQKICNSESGSTLQIPDKQVGSGVFAPPKSQLEIEQARIGAILIKNSHRYQLLYSHMG